MAGSLTSVVFVTFTSSVPLWLVREQGLRTHDPLIGWTLAVFSLAAGGGSLLGGILAPRLGRRPVFVGSLVLAAIPMLAFLRLTPGTVPFFAAAAFAGALIYTSSPINVVVAQDLAPESPAAAAGVVLGVTAGAAGVLYIASGRLQELIGLTPGLAVGFTVVLPAAAIALTVLTRHPEAAQ